MKITSMQPDGPAKYEQIITVQINSERHGLELAFRFKPNATERAKLKRGGYKWHYKKMVWYATNTPDHAAVIGTLAGTIKYPDGWNVPDRAADPVEQEQDPEKHAGRYIAAVDELGDYLRKYPVYSPEVLEIIGMSLEDLLNLDDGRDANDLYIDAVRQIKARDEMQPAA